MTARQYNSWRMAFDFLIGAGLLAMILRFVFFLGTHANQMDGLRAEIAKMQTERGAVKISIEASERLSCLEAKIPECKQ